MRAGALKILSVHFFSFLVFGLLSNQRSFSQNITTQLQKAFQQFESDPQLSSAISSLYVIDAKTGKVVFDKNSRIGLAPASTLKVITSVTAFEMLGSKFRYQTSFVLAGLRMNPSLKGLQIVGSGDPSFGSWRFQSTRDFNILPVLTRHFSTAPIQFIELIDYQFGRKSVPDGYIWEDMGNYYGSGHYQLNWKENQYDVGFKTSKEGLESEIALMGLDTSGYDVINEVKAGPKGSGDQAYIYSAPYGNKFYMSGTVPPDQQSFTISGSDPDPSLSFARALRGELAKQNASFKKNGSEIPITHVYQVNESIANTTGDTVYRYYSPTLDSLVYWFNKKSINLYGEALIKTMAVKKYGFATTDSGVVVVREFWKKQGIDPNELNISDGSGLSPLNRVTTHAQVEILKYARNKEWFPEFYQALPEYNGMKMKSGTIRDVKGFCGYQKSADGHEYIFSFLVNNYNGSASAVVNKMYKVLNLLK